LIHKERANYILSKIRTVWRKYYRKINNNYKKGVRKYYLKFKGEGSIPKKLYPN